VAQENPVQRKKKYGGTTTPEALIVVSSGAKQRRVWLRFEWVAQENPAQNFFF
jgi:hypothetical protein